MISRNALLVLKDELASGKAVGVCVGPDMWIQADEIQGVHPDSHVIIRSGHATHHVPLDKIVVILVTDPNDQPLES